MKIERSIIFQTTNDVPDFLIAAGEKGLAKSITLVPGYVSRFCLPETVVVSRDLPNDRQSCWGPQLDAGRLAETVNSVHNSGAYWHVFLCNRDLYQEGDGWVFGSTIADVISVLSVARFMNPRLADSQREIAVTRLLAHEVGHLLGLVERSHDVVNLYGLHCTNVCIMRQALTPLRWIKSALEETERGIDFCSACTHEMSERWDRTCGA
jgi:predicted Zn-dependent protease